MNSEFQYIAGDSAWIIGIHTTWVLALVFALSKFMRNTFYKRALWRSSFVGMLLLIFITFTGLYQWTWAPQVKTQDSHAHIHNQPQWSPMVMVEDSIPGKTALPKINHLIQNDAGGGNTKSPSFLSFLLKTWLMGGVILLGLMIVNAFVWKWRLSKHAKPASTALCEVFTQASKHMNYSQTPNLVESPRVNSPLVIGCIRPLIAFPKYYATRYNKIEQRLIMRHEIAHLREKDGWWQCLANLVCVTLWWHPLVWMARQNLRQSAEETADALSAHQSRDREQLAACLVRIGREISLVKLSGSLSIFGAGFRSQLGKRVERLMRPHPSMNVVPKRVGMVTTRLITPILLTTIIFASASWLNLNTTKSATDSFQRSIFGMMLLAEDTSTDVDGVKSTKSEVEHKNQDQRAHSNPPQVSTERNTKDLLKSIIIPEFTYTVKPDQNDIPGVELTLKNLNNLRDSILEIEPLLENLTFQLRIPAKLHKDEGLNLSGTPASNNVMVMEAGPLSEVPKGIPKFDRFGKEPHPNTLSKPEGVSSLNAIGYVKTKDKSALDLLFAVMQIFNIEHHHHFGRNVVVFDLNQVSGEALPVFTNMPVPSKDEADQSTNPVTATKETELEPLYTRIYKVNPKTFFERIKAVLGKTKPDTSEDNQNDIQHTIENLFQNLGIEVQSNSKSILMEDGPVQNFTKEQPEFDTPQNDNAFFYNDRNGSLFVRATAQELQILEAALSVLQDPGERNTKIGIDMHVVQLDGNGIKVLEEFGFNKPSAKATGNFEHIIETDTLKKLMLRLNLGPGIKLLQSPKVTTMDGRSAQLAAQELRLIISRQDEGHLETKEVATGPSLNVTPKLRPDGKVDITAHFKLLEFLGYDDPGPFRIIAHEDDSPKTVTPDKIKTLELSEYQNLLSDLNAASKEDRAPIILKYIPDEELLRFLLNERNHLAEQHSELEQKIAKNPNDLNKIRLDLERSEAVLTVIQKKLDQEIDRLLEQILAHAKEKESATFKTKNPNNDETKSSHPENIVSGESNQGNPVPLPRFKNLELDSRAVLESGQTLIMGGIKTIQTFKWKNNVPIMSKIPLIGDMFRREGTSTNEQYIYVLITPRILE